MQVSGISEDLLTAGEPQRDDVPLGPILREVPSHGDSNLVANGGVRDLLADLGNRSGDEPPRSITVRITPEPAISHIWIPGDEATRTICKPEFRGVQGRQLQSATVPHRTSMPDQPQPQMTMNELLETVVEDSLQRALERARLDTVGVATLTLPTVAIHALIEMLGMEGEGEYEYRRRQLIKGYGRHVLLDAATNARAR